MGGRDGNRDGDKSSLFRKSERERNEIEEGKKSKREGMKTGRESERGGNIAKKIDDGKG